MHARIEGKVHKQHVCKAHIGKHSGRKARTHTHTHRCMQTRTHAHFSPQTGEWMDGATGVVVNNAHMHTLLPLSLPSLPLAHSRVPLSSHHRLYSALPPSLPPSSPLSLFPSTLRHLLSHSIMLLLDVFTFSHFNLIHFPSPLFLPSPFIFLPFFPPICLICSPPYCPLNPRSISLPQLLSSLSLAFSFLFHPLLLPSSLAVVSYLSLWRRHSGIYENSLSNSS